jgi:hypothetical protein
MQDEEPKRGLLAQLPPWKRFAVIVVLAGFLVWGLRTLDPAGFAEAWRDEPLELIERVLNIFVAVGTIWIVLCEGDAILAAFARVFAERFAITFSALTEALKRAGLSAPSIQAILSDIRTRLWSRTARAQPAPPPRPDEPETQGQKPTPAAAAPEPSVAATGSTASATAAQRPRTAPRPRRRIPWRIIAGVFVLAVAAFFVPWRSLQWPGARPGPPPPPPPPQEVWITATGSVSETLAACMGRPSWEAVERSVAEANEIACSDRPRAFTCTVQNGQPLRLTPDVTPCVEGFQTFPTREAAAQSR